VCLLERQLSDTIDEMSSFVNTSSAKTQEALLQRYRELYFDFKTEFRRSMVRRCGTITLVLESRHACRSCGSPLCLLECAAREARRAEAVREQVRQLRWLRNPHDCRLTPVSFGS